MHVHFAQEYTVSSIKIALRILSRDTMNMHTNVYNANTNLLIR